MNIGKAMQTIREELGLSRPEMAERLGCSKTAVWKIENGKVWPKWKTIHKFIAEAHIPVSYFFSKAMDLEDYICP